MAAYSGHQEVVELLVEVGNAQLNKQDEWGRTALHWAAYGGQLVPAKYLVARGCSLTVQYQGGNTALDIATENQYHQIVQFLTSASNLITNNDYSSLRSLCTPFTSPFLARNVARQLRYTTILAARHARHIHDDPSLHTPLDPFLLRLALLPSADNRSPKTESQVFWRVLTYLGAGFDYVEQQDVEHQVSALPPETNAGLMAANAALTATSAVQQLEIGSLTATNVALELRIGGLTATNVALELRIAELTASSTSSDSPSKESKRLRAK
jgi:hypothetical protein